MTLPSAGAARSMVALGVDVRGLTWRPLGRRAPVLREVDLRLEPGERVLLAGPSGAGKSTLLRALAGVLGLAEAGDLSGEVLVGGRPASPDGRAGLLLQEPGEAVVAPVAWRDAAFGPENLGLPPAEVRARALAALDAVGFPYGPRHPTSALSGGEAQRLTLAGALAMGPGLLLLDEPTSMLDPEAAARVRHAVLDVAADTTLVVVEHRLGPWLDQVDRVVVLSADGEVIADGSPAQVLGDGRAHDDGGAGEDSRGRRRHALAQSGLWLPGLPPPVPLAVDRALLAPFLLAPVHPGAVATRGSERGSHQHGTADELVAALDVTVEHARGPLPAAAARPAALDGVTAALDAGRVTAVRGPSGAGKSTLVATLAGLLRPRAGAVTAAPWLRPRLVAEPWRWRSRELAARVGWVPQRPEHGFVARTVRDEVLATPRALRRERDAAARCDLLLEVLGLARLAGADPYRLSGGEQRRLVVAAALAAGPAVLLLDEPTVGQDRTTWAAVAGAVAAARDAGAAVGVATHDADLAAALADATVALHRGRRIDVDPSGDGRRADGVVSVGRDGGDSAGPDGGAA